MTEAESIIETCSACELAELRRMGVAVSCRLKGQPVETTRYGDAWKYRRRKAKAKEKGRPSGRPAGSGYAVRSNRSERWGSIKQARRELGVSERQIMRAIHDGVPCCGRMLWIEKRRDTSTEAA